MFCIEDETVTSVMEIIIKNAKDPYKKPIPIICIYDLNIMEFHADFKRCSDLFLGAGDSSN